jgi:hypothetical protein
LPTDELPKVRGRGRSSYGVARFSLDLAKAGTISFKLTGNLKKLDLFVNDSEIKLPDDKESVTIEVDRPAGRSKVTVIGLLGTELGELSVELLGDAGAFRLVR